MFHFKGRFLISQNLMSRIIANIYTITDIMPMKLQNSHRKVKSVITIHHDESNANTDCIDSIHICMVIQDHIRCIKLNMAGTLIRQNFS